MRRMLTAGAVVLLLSATTTAADQPALSYTVTVVVDERTHADFKALTDWMVSTPTGAIPDSAFEHGSAAMAEIVAAAETRADRFRWLTLDSGEAVLLQNGNTVYVEAKRAGSGESEPPVPLIAIHIGQGFATTLGRQDVIVPSGL